MMVNDILGRLPPTGLWEDNSSPAVHKSLKGAPGQTADEEVKPSFWQLIFLQSRANGCLYDVEDLPHANWQWPTNTWFQVRLVQQLKDPRDYQPLA